MTTGNAPHTMRLIVRGSLTVIFAAAMVVAFAVGRPVVGVIMLVFVSIVLLVQLLRERDAPTA